MSNYLVLDWRRAVAQQPKSALSSTDKLVAHTLMIHMSADGGSCFPSLDTLAAEASLTKDTVVKTIAKLEREGWIRVVRGGGRGNSNRYYATVPYMVGDNDTQEALGLSVGADMAVVSSAVLETQRVDLTGETVELTGEKGLIDPTVGSQEDPKEDHATPSRRARSSSSSAPPAQGAPRAKPRNIVWDVLVEHFPAPTTKSETADFAKTMQEIRQVLADRDPDANEAMVRQQIGLRVAQMGEGQYRTHRVLRRDWGRLGTLAGLDRPTNAVGVVEEEPNPLGQLTECEICDATLPAHMPGCPHEGKP